jgi:excisionase family DNA binding protein
MIAPRPFSPETLSERWGCSAEKVRRMYHDGELSGFRLGKLIRITANEVERYECQNTELSNTAEDSPSPITMTSEDAFELRLARMTAGSRRLALATSGAPALRPKASG